MVILQLYDINNGYRYRKISLNYYNQIVGHRMISEAWIVPGTYHD